MWQCQKGLATKIYHIPAITSLHLPFYFFERETIHSVLTIPPSIRHTTICGIRQTSDWCSASEWSWLTRDTARSLSNNSLLIRLRLYKLWSELRVVMHARIIVLFQIEAAALSRNLMRRYGPTREYRVAFLTREYTDGRRTEDRSIATRVRAWQLSRVNKINVRDVSTKKNTENPNVTTERCVSADVHARSEGLRSYDSARIRAASHLTLTPLARKLPTIPFHRPRQGFSSAADRNVPRDMLKDVCSVVSQYRYFDFNTDNKKSAFRHQYIIFDANWYYLQRRYWVKKLVIELKRR